MMSTKEISDKPAPQDALLNGVLALQTMYAEFAEEEYQLAEMGSASYARILVEEERGEDTRQVTAIRRPASREGSM